MMGVGHFNCHKCNRVCVGAKSDYPFCQCCENAWCSHGHAIDEGWRYDGEDDYTSCSFCRNEDVEDPELFEFALSKLDMTRTALLDLWKETQNGN